jgi:ferritin-like metal-binding protein YciE
MKRIIPLNDLLMEEISDLLSGENQLVEVLPKMAQAGHSSSLKFALEDHLDLSKGHSDRLQEIFASMRHQQQQRLCKDMQALIKCIENLLDTTEKNLVRDIAMINAAQKVEQFSVGRYKIAREHAIDLGYLRISESLGKSLNEERAINLRLNELAQGLINAQALHHV